jgi:hypothetical protein
MATIVATKRFFQSGHGDRVPGEVFEIADRHARTLKAIGKAKDPPREQDLLPRRVYRTHAVETEPEIVPEAVAEQAQQERALAPRHSDDAGDERAQVLSALRARATALGIEVDGRWGEERLRSEISAVRSRYEHRAMQAKE